MQEKDEAYQEGSMTEMTGSRQGKEVAWILRAFKQMDSSDEMK
jgi:hypothetical protein